MRRWFYLCLGCLISAACLWLVLQRIDLTGVRPALMSIGLGTALAAMLIYLAGFIPRGLRWHLMLRDLGNYSLGETTRSVVLGYAVNNILPFRLGEVVRAASFAKLNGTSRVTTLSSILAERLLDLLSLILIFSATLGGAGHFAGDPRLKPVLAGAGLLGGCGVAVLVMLSGPGRGLIVRLAATWPGLTTLTEKIFAAMTFFRSFRRLLMVASLSLIIWLWEGLVFVVLATALHLPTPWLTGYFTLCVVNFSILIPSAPGFLGVFQAAAVLAAIILRHQESAGLALGILVHAAQFLPITLLGIALAWPLWTRLGGWRGMTSFSNDARH